MTRPYFIQTRVGFQIIFFQGLDMESRKLAVIMFTDMVGYSRKVLEDEAKAMQLLAKHNGILEGRINAHNRNVIKTINDAFLADFDSAVNCAVDIQEELVDLNNGNADQTEVRIGIHVGDVIYRENDVFGDGVNVASRIESEAGPGQISSNIFSITYGKVDYKFKDLKSRELKNIDRPVLAVVTFADAS
ncbi:MAG TPA: hypothetical protein DIU35_10470 [Candidatus Latescibacteria bacterium]|nr:hypothetical protein [Candidatus Latescibacterota bacterium]